MKANEYENTIFQVLNVKNDGIITVIFENFKFNFFVVKAGAPLDTIVDTKNGYIECANKNGQFLYIYCGTNVFSVNSNLNHDLHTYFYFVSNTRLIDLSLNDFSFRFSGGVINKIIPPFALDIDSDQKDKIVIGKRKNNINIKMHILNIKTQLQFYSEYVISRSIDKGASISETDSVLDVIGKFNVKDLFSIESELSNVFSFMMYRKVDNNYKIELLVGDNIEGKEIKRPIATCFYRSLSSNNRNVDKSLMNIITMNGLGKNRFVKLYEIINNKEKDNGFNIDFIPEEGRVNIVDKIRVKETVTAVECLLNKYNIYGKNTQTKNLIKELKKMVDDCNDENIDDEIKKQIKSSIGYSNYPLKHRIREFYKNEQNEIKEYLQWLKDRFDIDFTNIDDIIEDIVDYRNTHTHDSIGILNNNILRGVNLFNAMIYSKVLKEIGVLKENVSAILIDCLK